VASDDADRQAALVAADEEVGRRHNALGITAPVDPTARPFHGRPFLVMGGDRFAAASRPGPAKLTVALAPHHGQ